MLWYLVARPQARATRVMYGVFGDPKIWPAEWFSITITSTWR